MISRNIAAFQQLLFYSLIALFFHLQEKIGCNIHGKYWGTLKHLKQEFMSYYKSGQWSRGYDDIKNDHWKNANINGIFGGFLKPPLFSFFDLNFLTIKNIGEVTFD